MFYLNIYEGTKLMFTFVIHTKFTMINIDDFIKRIETLLEYYNISASVFADKLGVQRSGLSHLLSGRNKPSLDFVMKIIENFPEVDLYWLLNGAGNFPKNDNVSVKPLKDIVAPAPVQDELSPKLTDSITDTEVVSQKNTENVRNLEGEKNSDLQRLAIENDEIEKIVVFYKNGIFKSYIPG
jgi:transcriptional regulator with XRE-family HTH domain